MRTVLQIPNWRTFPKLTVNLERISSSGARFGDTPDLPVCRPHHTRESLWVRSCVYLLEAAHVDWHWAVPACAMASSVYSSSVLSEAFDTTLLPPGCAPVLYWRTASVMIPVGAFTAQRSIPVPCDA